MGSRADAHIHLFAGGFGDKSFASRPGVSIEEPVCYDSLAREHGVAAALVVGYSADKWCLDNNAYVADQATRFDWIRPVAYVAMDSECTVENLERLRDLGFVGISMYVFGDDAQRLNLVPAEFWGWLEDRSWLVSVNSQSDAWTGWQPVLARFPRLPLLVSHLGLPPAVSSTPGPQQAADNLRHVTELANYPAVHVKLSGFYSLTSPGHDYPHQAAWPYVEQLVETFSCDRLLWASDFTPCLDWLTFPQTIDLFDKMPFLNGSDVAKITSSNLLALLKAVK